MLLQAYFRDQHFKINILKDNSNGLEYEEDIHTVIRVLHLREYKVDQNQLSFFDEGIPFA